MTRHRRAAHPPVDVLDRMRCVDRSGHAFHPVANPVVARFAQRFVAAPKPKRPQMFSAQTPIAVPGKLADFEVALPPGAEAETVVRIITSPIVVPFQWIFTEREPADGEIACKRAWGREPPGQDSGTMETRGPKSETEKARTQEAGSLPRSPQSLF